MYFAVFAGPITVFPIEDNYILGRTSHFAPQASFEPHSSHKFSHNDNEVTT